ncbi:putative DNA damage checkpoint protein [Clavispora lusitaniae]|uniref:DNA damage checkpoint protein n=1 Tax=Clavispora lusitaniae TaxID=36911 RepID=A0ACD0WKC5_CLALS|nr:putative DNA damage checkpoint protein [Clavispora lusitaniae]QFZ32793.1 putative DNA damage checkpoint protein [Clavispora lusitaniae]QFZ38463.1 putative DNA damage checkpoint protein [Clavispora lusitaniae]QFZ44145.1 putative DNA damage checkpoint protein [Clavispora lusitaniae]QFZ49823.1 putative DNA damage checkpoint protein [Clavispora lusitaniae]
MSFVAAIDSPTNIATWSRCVISLAAISEHICFSIFPDTLALSAINSSRTTHGEIAFTGPFFHDYDFQTDLILPEGFSTTTSSNSNPKYSFVVASKHMLTLFKNLEPSNLSYIFLRVDCNESTPIARRNKLLVEILTKKLIVKKYQMNYSPVEHMGTAIGTSYKTEFEEGNVNFFMMETAIMKSFFDMVPLATEDLSIDVKTTKISFGAYTKQVLKDREYLKQPMSITISMAVNELMDSNLGDVSLSVNFRLKDFRTFIALCTSLKTDGRCEPQYFDGDPHFEAYFKKNGDPIFFEFKSQNAVVRFIQFTADENATVDESKEKYVLVAPTISRAGTSLTEMTESVANSRQSQIISLSPSRASRFSSYRPESDDFPSTHHAHRHIVTYGKAPSDSPDRQPTARNSDTDYNTSDENEGEQQTLGPTQTTNKPVSLFE